VEIVYLQSFRENGPVAQLDTCLPGGTAGREQRIIKNKYADICYKRKIEMAP